MLFKIQKLSSFDQIFQKQHMKKLFLFAIVLCIISCKSNKKDAQNLLFEPIDAAISNVNFTKHSLKPNSGTSSNTSIFTTAAVFLLVMLMAIIYPIYISLPIKAAINYTSIKAILNLKT